MKLLFTALMFGFCLFAFANQISAQICLQYPCVVDSSGTGETASAAIDNFLAVADESKERVFVIARPGIRETKSEINLARLCDARAYMLSRLVKSESNKRENLPEIIFAEGEAVKGEGRLEFYLGSKLMLSRLIKPFRQANLDCCGELTSGERKQKQRDCRNWKQREQPSKSLERHPF